MCFPGKSCPIRKFQVLTLWHVWVNLLYVLYSLPDSVWSWNPPCINCEPTAMYYRHYFLSRTISINLKMGSSLSLSLYISLSIYQKNHPRVTQQLCRLIRWIWLCFYTKTIEHFNSKCTLYILEIFWQWHQWIHRRFKTRESLALLRIS